MEGGAPGWCSMSELRQISEVVWELRLSGEMRVPGRVFADAELLDAIGDDGSLEQLRNVATLPGIVDAALAMPDVHQGYGFPVGGVAATAMPDGVVSPGGVGFDINCGVRLLALPLTADEIGERREALVHELSRAVPAGTGRGSGSSLSAAQLDAVLADGPRALEGVDASEDVALTESKGRLEGANPDALSARARERGADQLGTLGSGNHFLELQHVDELYDREAADGFGLRLGQATVLIHSGSRGLGHQVCTDYVKRFDAAVDRYGIRLADRQLACAPASSEEGRGYLAAMAAAANFAWANRQLIAHRVRGAIARVLGEDAAGGTRQVYDVAHNVAKLERHGDRELCVHRKGATRAFPGQAVFIPGSMGTASYVLAGAPGAVEHSFGTACHGAGRRLSRTAARKQIGGAELRRQLEQQGITVRSGSNRGLAEEAPFAYKDVEKVVAVVERAGLAVRVARLRPIGVVKG
jgi:tRNA-splicing ligase RtcB